VGFAPVCRIAALVIAAAGCSSSSSPASHGGTPDASAADAPTTSFTESAMRAASVAYLTKFCTAMQRCNLPSLQVTYGSLGACIDADAGVADLASWFPYGSRLTPTGLQKCADALTFDTCEDFFRYSLEAVIPPECDDANYGRLPTGAPCATFWGGTLSNQCESGHCDGAGGACGQCAPEPHLGDHCNSYTDCPASSTCAGPTAATATCVALADVGATCDEVTTYCHSWLVCGADHTCAVPPADGSCDPTVGCDYAPFPRNCDLTTLHCTDAVAQPGEACGYLAHSPGDLVTYCVAGYTCALDDDAGPDASTYVGHCVPMLAEGQSCDLWQYVPFQNPCSFTSLRGDGCNNGKCQYFGAPVCSGAAPPP